MRFAALCVALIVTTWGGVALGQTEAATAPDASPAGVAARELFRRGEAAYSAGNYELAIREWTNAYEADPRPRIQFNLSQAYERLGELEDAMAALRKFLESGDPDDPTYSDANARLSALQQRLALTGVVVQGGAEGGSILVDDKDWGRTPRPDKIPLAPGSHVLVVKWADRPEFRTNVVVPAGQVIQVTVPNDGASAPPPAPLAQTGLQVDSDQAKRDSLMWYLAGGGAAAAGVGLIAYGVVRGAAADDCGGSTYCNPDDEDLASTQSLVGYVAGGALVAAGAALIVVGVLKGKSDESRASTQCGVGFASASCRVQF